MTYRSEHETAFARAAAAYDDLLGHYVRKGWVLDEDPPLRDAQSNELLRRAATWTAKLAVLEVQDAAPNVLAAENVPDHLSASTARRDALAVAALDANLALPSIAPALRERIAHLARTKAPGLDVAMVEALPIKRVPLSELQAWRFECATRAAGITPFTYLGLLPAALLMTRDARWMLVSFVACVVLMAFGIARRRPVLVSFGASGVVIERQGRRLSIPFAEIRQLTSTSRGGPVGFPESRLLLTQTNGVTHELSFLETAPGSADRLRAWCAEVRRRASNVTP